MINILGIKNKDDRYVIPIPTWSKTVYAAGTEIHYYHEKDIDINTVYITGPTTEKLTIVVSNKFRKVLDSQSRYRWRRDDISGLVWTRLVIKTHAKESC